ncbi:nitroreductase [Polymorphobacter arshaanensis]|uniref:Putative NAD(P)H nitroreductase n=1 Tax=Glacieibacterium arshaanense TaxID=2511025 RepID=A0A4Y9ERP9_9SPHN|nr:nitroreductase [Polymorphobacter arshaanensis]TFU06030.1 nitroreductase [Polymorphobacter arshaanensis]
MDNFNDISSPRALLATRRSGKAREMVAPGPDAAQLAAMLASAARVPDHGKLAPWRFITVAPEARAGFAALLETAYRHEHAAPGATEIEAIRSFAHQAPCLVIVVSQPVSASHIPRWEQELSAGAATMQLCNAAHAQGFVANWLTGWACYSRDVADALGIEDGRIAGFVFIGTQGRPLAERPRPAPGTVVRAFTPDAT